jgi:hypothetical protein
MGGACSRQGADKYTKNVVRKCEWMRSLGRFRCKYKNNINVSQSFPIEFINYTHTLIIN